MSVDVGLANFGSHMRRVSLTLLSGSFFSIHLRAALTHTSPSTLMATTFIVGVTAVTAAILGRSLIKQGLFVGKKGAEQWAKGGFRAKMDRNEAIQILGLKFVCALDFMSHF